MHLGSQSAGGGGLLKEGVGPCMKEGSRSVYDKNVLSHTFNYSCAAKVTLRVTPKAIWDCNSNTVL